MLQAWMILPALGIGYLLAAPGRLRRRFGHLTAAGAVMRAVSLSWIALYTVTPASSRPYVDGSTDNSAVAMVFGYNGLERFGITVRGAVTSGPGVTTGRQDGSFQGGASGAGDGSTAGGTAASGLRGTGSGTLTPGRGPARAGSPATPGAGPS